MTSVKILCGMGNSVDPDQSDLGLHFLHMPFTNCNNVSVSICNQCNNATDGLHNPPLQLKVATQCLLT